MKRYLFTNCTIVQGELFLIGALGGLLAKVNLENGNMSKYEMQKGFVQEKKCGVDRLYGELSRLYICAGF